MVCKEDKRFLQKLFELYQRQGKANKLCKDIMKYDMPESDKVLLKAHYVDKLPFKTVGVVLAKHERLAEPLSERQVHRRHDAALERASEAIIQGLIRTE